MHSKRHNVTDPVTQNDYLVLVSNALYSIYALWDVVLVFMRALASSEQTTIRRIRVLVARLCLDRVFRWRTEIMN